MEFEEERRLFYVALTRARKQLYLSRAARRQQEGYYRDTDPSTFLKELPEDVMTLEDRITLGVTDAMPKWSDAGGKSFDQQAAFRRNFPSRNYESRQFVQSRAKPSGGLKARGRGQKSFDVGDRVEHAIMGEGTVSEYGGRMGAERVYVQFDDGREQEFVVRFAPLKKIEEGRS